MIRWLAALLLPLVGTPAIAGVPIGPVHEWEVGEHLEISWASRVDIPLQFLLPLSGH